MEFVKKIARKNTDFSTADPVCMAFLGDSVTHGVFEIHEGPANGGLGIVLDYDAVYHAELRKLLNIIYPNAPINVVNAGISGSSAMIGLERLEGDVLRYSPDLVVVCFGLNDVNGGMEKLDEYGLALETIFRRLAERGAEVVLLTPNMLNTYVSRLTAPRSVAGYAAVTAELQNGGTMDAYMNRARQAANACGVPVCDCYGKWKRLQAAGVDTTMLLSNHINHPSREMHKLFAYGLYDLLLFDTCTDKG
jgi:acyl-CoA thioesterase I